MLTFRFRQSRSDELPWLIELAKRGHFKEAALSPKHSVYETTFDLLNPIHLGYAISLSTALCSYKSAEAFSNGQALQVAMVRAVLTCFQASQHIANHHAHCWFRQTYSFDLTVSSYTVDLDQTKLLLFPCRQAANQSHGIHPAHPGDLEHQVEAALLRAGTRWCPRLADLTEWRQALLIKLDRPRGAV